MNHVKMLGLLTAICAMAYAVLCVAGSERLMVSVSGRATGVCGGAEKALNRVQDWAPFGQFSGVPDEHEHAQNGQPIGPLRDMTVLRSPTGEQGAALQLEGAWGTHLLSWRTAPAPEGGCQLTLVMTSESWPFYLRGAAILLGFNASVEAELEDAMSIWEEQSASF